jgi:hypothetical protein
VRAILLPIRDIRRGGVGQPAEPFRPQRAGRETFVEMRDKLHNALLKLELRVQDVARREQRNAYLEHELKLQGAASYEHREGSRHAQAETGAVRIGFLRSFVCIKLAVFHKQRAPLGTAQGVRSMHTLPVARTGSALYTNASAVQVGRHPPRVANDKQARPCWKRALSDQSSQRLARGRNRSRLCSG